MHISALPRVIPRSLFALLVVGLASCSDPAGPAAGANEVRVGNNFFNPGTRTVTAGTTVTWIWNAGSTTHNVTFSGGPASPNQSSGEYSRLFDVVGSYPYTCTIHGAGMSGTIVVE